MRDDSHLIFMRPEPNRMAAAPLSVAERQAARAPGSSEERAVAPFAGRHRKGMAGRRDEARPGETRRAHDKPAGTGRREETIPASAKAQDRPAERPGREVEAGRDTAESGHIRLPYEPRCHTRAETARQKEPNPLAAVNAMRREVRLLEAAGHHVDGQAKDAGEALPGASDIPAGRFNGNGRCRDAVRRQPRRGAVIGFSAVKGKGGERTKCRDCFGFSEQSKGCAVHRSSALRRGKTEGVLKAGFSSDDGACMEGLNRSYVKRDGECDKLVVFELTDSYKHLIEPFLETESVAVPGQEADDETIRASARNPRRQLPSPPSGQERVSGLGSGFRTGRKAACPEAQGGLLHDNEAIYPRIPRNGHAPAQRKLQELAGQHGIQAIGGGAREKGPVHVSRPAHHFVSSPDKAVPPHRRARVASGRVTQTDCISSKI